MIGSSNWILRRSISCPLSAKPAAISCDVTEPNILSSSPTFTEIVSETCSIWLQFFGNFAIFTLTQLFWRDFFLNHFDKIWFAGSAILLRGTKNFWRNPLLLNIAGFAKAFKILSEYYFHVKIPLNSSLSI
ncbi:MAG: hypothetical protein R3C26_11420 [Calditrichia bacterium]